MAEAAVAGTVTYVPSRAKWFIGDVPAHGWVGRTLRRMRREGLLLVEVPVATTSETVLVARVSSEVAAELAESNAPPTT
ncbi:MAG: hypothetical protein H7Y15_12690 [Pseudonocardia sp.]|nr:hypothetical protein [Pseudonocardia sp.]